MAGHPTQKAVWRGLNTYRNMAGDTGIDPEMSERMRRIAEGDDAPDGTRRMSPEEVRGVESTRPSQPLPGSEEFGRDLTEIATGEVKEIEPLDPEDSKVLDGVKERISGLAERQGVLTMEDVREVLNKDVLLKMDDWQMRHLRRFILRQVRDLDTEKSGEALRKRTERLESEADLTEEKRAEIQKDYEEEAMGIRLMYDRNRFAEELDDYFASVRH